MLISLPRVIHTAGSVLSISILAGCGGGSGGTTPVAPATVTVGGTIAGLIGTVVLQNNAGDGLSVTANGSFTFKTAINKASSYAVTVSKQPLGPSCSVANGSGTATDNVSNVSVTCTTDPATAYLPLIAVPTTSSSGGSTGLAVISTKTPGDVPTLVVNEEAEYMSSVRRSDGSPYALFYTTFHTDGSNHLWSLSLTGDSTLVPTQVSNLSLPTHIITIGGQISSRFSFCSVAPIARKLSDAGSTFLILGLPAAPDQAPCLDLPSTYQWQLVHATDSATTAPVTLPITSQVVPLYGADGVLTGLVATDSSNHLNFYADETFTNPTQLLANVGFFDFPQATATTPAASGPTTAYLTVHPPGTSPYSGTGGSVYRIDSKGTLSADLYDFQGMVTRGLTVVDQDHAYLIDGASVVEIAQGVAQTLYTFPDNRAQFLGYVAQHLIFQTSTGGAANTLQSLAAGSPGAPVTIGNYSQNTVVTLLGNSLLVSHYPAAAASEPASTELLDASGTALRPLLPGSAFVSSSSPALMANHIPGPTLAGGEIDVLDLSQSNTSGPALKNASGSTYTLPSGANSVDLHQVTATVGIGSMKASTEGSVPLEYDLSSGVITPVTFANTKLSFVGF